jgi:hypothetical protein
VFDRRLYIAGIRIHHGLAGAVLLTLGVILLLAGILLWGPAGIAMIAAGAILMFHDRRDWPWPLRDRNPA